MLAATAAALPGPRAMTSILLHRECQRSHEAPIRQPNLYSRRLFVRLAKDLVRLLRSKGASSRHDGQDRLSINGIAAFKPLVRSVPLVVRRGGCCLAEHRAETAN